MKGLKPHERLAFGLRIPRPTHPQLRQLKGGDTPQEQGHKAWNAGWLLMDFLQRHPPKESLRVLDIGCGWGLCGLFCARTFSARVTSLDIDPRVFPFVALHARLNDVEIDTQPISFSDVDRRLLALQDIVLGADICYRHALISPLLGLVERALDAGVDQLLIADPGRPPFLAFARHCVEHLNGTLGAWETDEPLLAWPGQRPTIRGHVLLMGKWPAIQLA